MSLVSVIIILVVVGVVLYLLTTLPIDPVMKNIIRAVIVIAVCIWILELAGIIGQIHFGSRVR